MTKQEQIRKHYAAIRATAYSPVGSGSQARVKSIRRHLARIEDLLQQDEPETLASSVLRLTNICNALERENATLRNDLTDMTLNYNAAEKHVECLKTDLKCKNGDLDAAFRNNDTLRSMLARKKDEFAALEACLRRVKSLRATCSKVMANAGVTELRASNVQLLRRNKGLEEEIARKNNTITLLKERNDRLGADLDGTEALLTYAKRKLDQKDELLAALEIRIGLKDACIGDVQRDLKELKKLLEQGLQ